MPTSRRPALLSLPPARPAASRTRAHNSAHVCPSHCTDQRGGPNASTDADQLVARRSSDSAMDGGREERPEAAEASPNPPSIMPKQPGSGQPLGQLVKQPTGAQRASGRASLSGEQARRARSRRLPGPGRARGVASPQHPPSFWPPPPPRSSPAGGHAPFNIPPRRSGQTGGHTDARGCQGPRRGGGCVGATDHPRERAQKVCPGSAPSQPRIGSPTHSEALQWHRRRRARAQSAALLLAALARWLMNTIKAPPLAPRGRPETTPRPRTASASRRAATESAHVRPEQSRCLARLALGAATSPSRRCRGPPRTLGIY